MRVTFSGNQGVMNGIWNVLQYECRVSKESGDTAPSIEKTPLENWLQTENRKRRKVHLYSICHLSRSWKEQKAKTSVFQLCFVLFPYFSFFFFEIHGWKNFPYSGDFLARWGDPLNSLAMENAWKFFVSPNSFVLILQSFIMQLLLAAVCK